MDEVRNEMINYLPRLVNGIKEMVTFFHSQKISNGLNMLSQIIEGLDWVAKAYGLIPGNNPQHISGLNNMLYEINNALTNKDYVLTADIFEYEIISILENIQNETNKSASN